MNVCLPIEFGVKPSIGGKVRQSDTKTAGKKDCG